MQKKLLTVFAGKIKFYEFNEFSWLNCFNKQRDNTKKRIAELKKSIVSVNEIILFAKAKNKSIPIKSIINFSFRDEV